MFWSCNFDYNGYERLSGVNTVVILMVTNDGLLKVDYSAYDVDYD